MIFVKLNKVLFITFLIISIFLIFILSIYLNYWINFNSIFLNFLVLYLSYLCIIIYIYLIYEKFIQYGKVIHIMVSIIIINILFILLSIIFLGTIIDKTNTKKVIKNKISYNESIILELNSSRCYSLYYDKYYFKNIIKKRKTLKYECDLKNDIKDLENKYYKIMENCFDYECVENYLK